MEIGEPLLHPENPRMEFRVEDNTRLDTDGNPILDVVPNVIHPEDAKAVVYFQREHLKNPNWSYYIGTQVANAVINGVKTRICFHITV